MVPKELPPDASPVRKQPCYAELDSSEQQRALKAVSEACSEISAADRSMPRVVVPARLNESTRQVLEARRRDGYKVPEYLELPPHERERVKRGDAPIWGWAKIVKSSSGAEPPNPSPPYSEFDYEASTIVTGLCAALVCCAIAAPIADAADSWWVMCLAAIPAVAAAVARFAYMRRRNRQLQPAWNAAEPYRLTYEHEREIRNRSVRVSTLWPEIQLATVAEDLAKKIEQSEAWRDAVLDEHRIVFSPADEARQVLEHAMRIAAIRCRLGEAPDGDSTEHEQARRAIDAEVAVLDQIVLSLRERVAALWSYASRVEQLSSQIAALHALKNSMTLAPELDALARQTGVDAVATDHLHALAADAATITARIAATTAALTGTLQPLMEAEAGTGVLR